MAAKPCLHDRDQYLQRDLIGMPHDIIIAIFVLLLLAVVCWLLVYRQLDPQNRSLYPLYRLHQRLLVIIAILVILLPILVVLSSDPGHSTDYLFWP